MDIIREEIKAATDNAADTLPAAPDVPFARESCLFPDAYFGGLRWAVLDIETLGLSPGRAPAILCGIVTPAASSAAPSVRPQIAPEAAQITQFFAESVTGTEDEEAMLRALEEALLDIDILVTYNGRNFDLPYLAARRAYIGLAPMRPRYNLDLLQVVRYCTDIRKFVPNLQQKTLEAFCGLWQGRTDEISGKESVSLYYDYLAEREPSLKEKILLHNRDDIAQLFRLTSILRRADMHRAAFRFGFPVRADGGAAGRTKDRCGQHRKEERCGASCTEKPLLLVEKIELKNGHLLAAGTQSPAPNQGALSSAPDQDSLSHAPNSGTADSPRPSFGGLIEEIHYGDEQPSWRFLDGKFELTIPVICHQGLRLADTAGIAAGLAANIPPHILTAGYVILANGEEMIYENCNLLIKAILTGILQGE